MLVSVIICTRNRSRQLANVLRTFEAMTPPVDATYELLVVDNGSTDDTAQVIAEFSDRLPIRRIFEPTPGLSNARNAGVREAAGEYICWTDDDVEVDPEWINSYVAAFRQFPDVSIFGGMVEPVFEKTPPEWMTDNLSLFQHLLAKRDFGPVEVKKAVTLDNLPYGANFAVRAAEQKGVLYDPALGVSPTHKRLGEETCALVEISKLNNQQVWVPASKVRHLIPASRMSLDYVAVYFKSLGETWAYLSDTGGPDIMGDAIPRGGRRLGNVPLWILRKRLGARLRHTIARARGKDPKNWLEDFMMESRLAGAWDYYRRS